MCNATWLLVLVVYSIAVWLARRGGIDLPVRVAAFFYLLVLVFLFPSMTSDVVNLPVDFLGTLPPWAYLTRYHHTVNSEINDLVLQIVPWAHQVRESWRSLEVPLWNHLSGSGYPLMANAQSSAFSLIRLLALPLTLGQSFTAEAAMKLLIALTFTYLFCRRRGYSEIASVTGAVCFGFCSFLIVWLHFPLVTVAAFVPAAVYQVDLLAERLTRPRFLFAAGLWTAMIFGGHPETVAHIFFISLLYVIWIVAIERRFTVREAGRFVLALGGALTVAALLAAPFLAPFAEAMTKSKRYHELKLIPNAIGYYSDWPSFVAMVQPRFFGAIPHEKPWGPATAESITGFAGALGMGAWLTVLLHVIATRKWRSRESFLVVATVIVLGIMMAWPGISELFHLVFRLAANARLRLLFCFLLAVQTAAAIDIARQRRWAFLAGVFASAALLLLFVTATEFTTPWRHDTAVLAVLPSVAVLAIALLLVFVTRQTGLSVFHMLLLTAIIAELWIATRAWNPNIRASMMYSPTPLITELRRLAPREPYRIVGGGPAFFVNVPAVFGFEDIRTHDPMANGRYLGVLRELGDYDTAQYFAKWENFHTLLLDYLNVKYVVAPARADLEDPGRYRMLYDGRDGRIFENTTVLPRFYPVRNVILEFNNEKFLRRLKEHKEWGTTAILENLPVPNATEQVKNDLLAPRPVSSPEATVRITGNRGHDFRMRVNAPRHTLVVSSIPWWPGWKISGGLRPIRVNGSFLGFVVPAGTHDVRVWYSPITFRAGLLVALATLAALVLSGTYGSAFRALFRRRA